MGYIFQCQKQHVPENKDNCIPPTGTKCLTEIVTIQVLEMRLASCLGFLLQPLSVKLGHGFTQTLASAAYTISIKMGLGSQIKRLAP
jgi:hypothetical protein